MLYSAFSEFPVLAIAALGFYISLRFLKFPDLTVDASFMFGMSAVGLLSNVAPNESISLILAPIFGAIVGVATGFLHTSRYLGINKFLSGMIVAFASYSICFRMCGQADLSLYEHRERFFLYRVFEGTPLYIEPLGVGMIAVFVWFVVQRLMNSSFGLALRTAGHRPDILRVSGLNPNAVTVFGLAFTNAIVAIAGWLDASMNRNVSLKSFGIIINVLAACLIGDFLRYLFLEYFAVRRNNLKRSVMVILLSPVVGALAYCLIKSFVIKVLSGQLTIALTTDLNFVVSVCIVLAILVGKQLRKFDVDEESGDV